MLYDTIDKKEFEKLAGKTIERVEFVGHKCDLWDVTLFCTDGTELIIGSQNNSPQSTLIAGWGDMYKF